MDSILSYKEFKKDVVDKLERVRLAYDLKIDETMFDPMKHHRNTHVFFSNEYVIIELNTILHFPYENAVGILFYLKGSKSIVSESLPLDYLASFIGVDITRGKYKQIYDGYKCSLQKIQGNSNRLYYQESLEYIDAILFEVFNPLLIGFLGYRMFDEWNEFVKTNKNLNVRDYKLPSYEEYKSISSNTSNQM